MNPVKRRRREVKEDSTNIIEPLRKLALPIGDLVPDPKNARRHSGRNIAAIKASLKKFGQRKPIVVNREGMVVIAGNGAVMAAKELGWESIAAVVVDDPADVAAAFALADNRTAELADWNDDQLEATWKQLDEDLREVTGFLEEEIVADEAAGEQEPEVVFSEYLGEANNYVVLFFRNDVDWLAAQTHFDLRTVASKRENGKPWSQGIGRVIDGAKYLLGLGGDQ